MAIVGVFDARRHLGITTPDDDLLLVGLVDGAQAHIESLLGFAIVDEFNEPPADLKSAVLQLVAHWFENREAALVGVTAQTLPMGVADVIANRRAWAF